MYSMILAGDLAERPAGVATEVEHGARRLAGWRPGGPEAVRGAHRLVEAAAVGRSPGGPVGRDHLGLAGRRLSAPGGDGRSQTVRRRGLAPPVDDDAPDGGAGRFEAAALRRS